MSQRTKRIVVAVIALLVAFSLIVPALAHSQLVDSDPADGATLDTTDTVSLTFNEDINPDFVTLVVTDPAGDDVTDGDPAVDGPVLTSSIKPTANGAHTVTYRVVSQDGHTVSGTVTFTLTGVPTPEPTPTPTQTATPEPAETPTPVATTDEPVAEGSGFTLSLGVGLTLGVLALAAVGAFVGYRAARQNRG